ncbi:hypothetical protein [Metabacillus sp. Hm71]
MELSELSFKEILENVYKISQETENISVIELIEEIKKEILLYTLK